MPRWKVSQASLAARQEAASEVQQEDDQSHKPSVEDETERCDSVLCLDFGGIR